MRVLAIGTHPDDIEFGMGATLAKHTLKGDEVYIIILTDGERYEDGRYSISYKRKSESINALEILGYKKEVLFLSLLEVTVQQPIIQLIEDLICDFKPDRIYTHSKNDRHQDHRNCCDIVLSAGRYIKEILLFEVYSAFPEFLPKYINNISRELLDLKIKAIKCFKTQFENMEMMAKIVESIAIKNSLYTFGRQINKISYSEAFEIVRVNG